jgi:hypothetical protein
VKGKKFVIDEIVQIGALNCHGELPYWTCVIKCTNFVFIFACDPHKTTCKL